jgi:hypothetical protein
VNRYHQRLCRSPDWAAYVADTLVPRALDGVSLGDDVLELGPGYGASTQPLAERTTSLTALESDPKLASRLRGRLGKSVTVVDGDATSMTFGASTFSAWSASRCCTTCRPAPHRTGSSPRRRGCWCPAGSSPAPTASRAGFRLIHLADTCNPVDPATLAARLTAAGFGQIKIDASHGPLSFVAQTAAS